MPTSVGPNTFGEENLVFGYDLGDTDNSFKGKSATNYLTTITPQYSDYDLTYFKITNGSHVVDVPQLGRRTVKYVDVWNDYNNGSGNCCLSLFTFGTGIDNVSGNTTYTYQIIYKTDTGYSNTNYMYRYEYGAAGYIREGGLHSTGRRTHLGDGWYHAWGTVTLHPDTTYINTYLFHYEYATKNRVQVAAVMFTEGTEIIPPSQFLEVEETRSNVQGLLDITGNSTIDISNATLDSNAQITFDGSDDQLTVADNTIFDTNNFTVEAVCKLDAFDNNHRTVVAHNASVYSHTNGWWIGTLRNGLGNGNNDFRIFVWGDSSYVVHSNAIGGSDGNYHHLVLSCDSTTVFFYIDGDLVYSASKPTGNVYTSGQDVLVGNSPNGDYWSGDIPLVKVYDRVLVQQEVTSNYNAIKGRFNI